MQGWVDLVGLLHTEIVQCADQEEDSEADAEDDFVVSEEQEKQYVSHIQQSKWDLLLPPSVVVITKQKKQTSV